MNPPSPIRWPARPFTLALLVAATLISGCGSSSDSTPSDEKTPQMRCAPAPNASQSCAS